MYNLKWLRENVALIGEGLKKRGEEQRLEPILALDERRREIISQVEVLKAERNRKSHLIGELLKKGENTEEIRNSVKNIVEDIKHFDEELKVIESELEKQISWLPNLPHSSVPVGKDPSYNVVIKECGEKLQAYFPVKDHLELGIALKILDFERGAKMSGSGFPVYIGKGASLERALINFMLNLHTREHGYKEVFPPFLVNRESLFGTGQIPKLEIDMYRCRDDELYLIPTAEVPVTNLHRDENFREKDLPVSYVAYTACFRREAGSYGRETRGFLRVHQFNKVELVKFVHPDVSYEEHEKLTRDAERVLELLEIPYRRVELCTGDLGFSASKCYDLEVWSPAGEKWLEASSCSNFEDFQARRMNIRFKPGDGGKPRYVHTMNGSGLATSRLIVSLLENNQTEEGTVMVPKVLVPYTGFSII
jgi:seryl-tRNA synthetase